MWVNCQRCFRVSGQTAKTDARFTMYKSGKQVSSEFFLRLSGGVCANEHIIAPQPVRTVTCYIIIQCVQQYDIMSFKANINTI